MASYHPPVCAAMAGSTARYASAEPAKSLVSATPTPLEMAWKAEPNTLFWLRKNPLGSAIRPGEKALTWVRGRVDLG